MPPTECNSVKLNRKERQIFLICLLEIAQIHFIGSLKHEVQPTEIKMLLTAAETEAERMMAPDNRSVAQRKYEEAVIITVNMLEDYRVISQALKNQKRVAPSITTLASGFCSHTDKTDRAK
jgi:hypothetical protein